MEKGEDYKRNIFINPVCQMDQNIPKPIFSSFVLE